MNRRIGLLLIILFLALVIYYLVNQIYNAYKSGERLSGATESLYNLEIKNRELKKRLTEVRSIEFIEQQARDKLSLGKEGETLVIITQDQLDKVLGVTKGIEEIKLPNWQGWLRLFFK